MQLKKDNNHFLYRHIRLDKNEPFYIGIGTKKEWFTDYETEYRRAFELHGRNKIWRDITKKTEYNIEVLLESDDYSFIKQKEIEFIKIYGRINNGTGILSNLTDGGEGSLGYKHKVSSRTKMSLSRKGKFKKGNIIYQYDLNGNFIKEWKSTREAERQLNLCKTSVSKCVNKVTPSTSGGFYWSKYNKFSYTKPIRSFCKKILQYDLDGNLVNKWNSIIDAGRYFNSNGTEISRCLRNKAKTSNGYKWKYQLV